MALVYPVYSGEGAVVKVRRRGSATVLATLPVVEGQTPVLTITFVLIVGTLLGGLGLLVAVPALAVIMVVVRRILLTRLYEGQGFRRTTRERPLVLRVPVPGGGVMVPPGASYDVVSAAEHAGVKKSA